MYWLDDRLIFPGHETASPEGLLAIGGDLSPKRLLLAYENGIFPWYNEEDPILWWSPNPRFVLIPSEVKVSKSMRKVLRNKNFKVSFDQEFESVMNHCSSVPRKGQQGTWLIEDMKQAYKKLHELGFAHSVEVWQDDKLVGGLYGVSIGKFFFGESMFALVSNASKVGLIFLANCLTKKGFCYIDCQQETKHLTSMGAKFIARKSFIEKLEENKKEPTIRGNWGVLFKDLV